jgi:hypothetical protein
MPLKDKCFSRIMLSLIMLKVSDQPHHYKGNPETINRKTNNGTFRELAIVLKGPEGNVHLALIWALHLKAKVFSLDRSQFRELSVNMSQVKLCNSLVQDLGQDIDTNFELLGLAKLDVLLAEGLVLGLIQQDLCKNLICERARHDK